MSSRGLPSLQGEGGLSRYLTEIRKFPLLAPEEEYMLAKRWKEHEDPEAARKLVTSHLRLVAKIAMGYRGYGLPVSEIVAEGNVGLMQAVKRFEPDKGFRLATYAMWWIRASIQEYILRSWSLVKMGTTAAQKKLFFNLRKAKTKIEAIEEGDMTPEHVAKIADQLGVPEQEVVNMNRRLSGPDSSLNAPLRSDSESEWQDWLADDTIDQETRMAEREEMGERHESSDRRIRRTHRTRTRDHRGAAPAGRSGDAGRAVAEIRRHPRTRPPDRSARFREAADTDETRADRKAQPRAKPGVIFWSWPGLTRPPSALVSASATNSLAHFWMAALKTAMTNCDMRYAIAPVRRRLLPR